MIDKELAQLATRLQRIKICVCVLYLIIGIIFCVSSICHWTMCLNISYIVFFFIMISSLVIENVLYRDYMFKKHREEIDE